jgi:N-acetylglucosamine kinase-like BadF-type ATPase
MILIADSGSTKTSWCIAGGKNSTRYFYTDGINPFFRTPEDIFDELNQKLLPEINGEVDQIYFYGAGIINEQKAEVIKTALQKLFPHSEIEILNDLLAAARATLVQKKGIACILGTGSNSCLYNGNEIVENVPPLGFILGDEGSGAALGKQLLADYLKGIMPKNISEKFQKQYHFSYAGFMEGVYKKEKPNRFLASFVPFIAENIAEKYCSALVENSFEAFLKRNVFRYPEYQTRPLAFVGSVAFYFREQLLKMTGENQLEIKTIVKDPMEGLLAFHLKK